MNIFSPLAIVAAAKMRADQEAKKPPAALPPVGLLDSPSPQAHFQNGTAVREILSGRTGVVVEPPAGHFGDLVFMKCDDDQKTYPVPGDQLERVEIAGTSPLNPVHDLAPKPSPIPAPSAEAVIPEAAKPGAEPAKKPGPKASRILATAVVTDAPDKRNIIYAALLESLPKPVTSAALIKSFGYVPECWDRLVASLAEDGVVVLRAGTKVDVRGMLKRGMNTREIIADACAASGPVRSETLRRIDAVRAGRELAARIKAAIAENKAKLKAAAPTKPQPGADPGPGMVWAWDNVKMDWYAFPISASLKAKQIAARTAPSKKPKVDEIEAKAQALYDKLLADDHKLFKAAADKFPKSNDGGTDTDGAVDFLMDELNAYDESVVPEPVAARLQEMIHGGLT